MQPEYTVASLARELGVPPKQLIAHLRALGANVGGVTHVVDPKLAEAVLAIPGIFRGTSAATQHEPMGLTKHIAFKKAPAKRAQEPPLFKLRLGGKPKPLPRDRQQQAAVPRPVPRARKTRPSQPERGSLASVKLAAESLQAALEDVGNARLILEDKMTAYDEMLARNDERLERIERLFKY